eukprot:COSAG05_NODE_8029_length_744_cov_0.956589_2_plen_64_part_00
MVLTHPYAAVAPVCIVTLLVGRVLAGVRQPRAYRFITVDTRRARTRWLTVFRAGAIGYAVDVP